MASDSPQAPGGVAFVELIRLSLIILGTGAALEASTRYDLSPTARLAATALGAGGAYVLGGGLGRLVQSRISTVERSVERIPTSEIVAGVVGTVVGVILSASFLWPVFLFGGKVYTVPTAVMLVATTGWAGWRIGRSRAADLLLYMGVGGRLPGASRSQGRSYNLVDSSALIDGRLVALCRDGWMDGILLIPTIVLHELQGLADSGDPERRRRGQRGLDIATELERLSTIATEVLDVASVRTTDVDLALVELAKSRNSVLITTDGNLGRVARVQGVEVRNIHELADSLRPPVQPGEHLEVQITKVGREPGQGVGFLPDGSMVVIEDASERIGEDVQVEVTSIMATSHGRMLFATRQAPDGDRTSASGAS